MAANTTNPPGRPGDASAAPPGRPGGIPGPARRRPGARTGAAARRRRPWRQWLIGYAFVTPAVALFLLMGLYTLGYSFSLSFAKWNGFSPTWEWVGLDNYLDLLYRDPGLAPGVRDAAVHTAIVVLAVPAGTVLLALPLAVLLNSIQRLRGLLRSVYFLPYVTTGIAVYYAWRYVLEPEGSINLLLRSLGLGSLARPQGFLGDPATALPTLIVIMIWSAVPVAMLLYLAGLQSIDPAVLEAAQLDGAGPVRTMRHITWPLLVPITAAVALLGVRDSMQSFQIFFVMTDGGPGEHTNVLGLEAYHQAFFKSMAPTLGLASALGWLIFLIALLLTVVNARILRRSQ